MTGFCTSSTKNEYEEQIRELRELKSRGASKNILRSAAQQLQQIKLASDSLQIPDHNTKVTEYHQSVQKSWDSYPEVLRLPLDSEGYVLAFRYASHREKLENAVNFFCKFGFVVFEEVLSKSECDATIAEIWDQLEEKNAILNRNKIETFDSMSSKTYGLAPQPAVFSKQILKNRSNPTVLAIFQAILQTQDIIISHDRWCLYRATNFISNRLGCRNSWKTPSNLHLDLNPWTYNTGSTPINDLKFEHVRDFSRELNGVSFLTGPNVQGIISLTDNCEIDGGTLIVPGFHHVFAEWCNTLTSMNRQMSCYSTNQNRLIWRGNGAGSYKFSSFDPIHTLKQRITMRAGSLLIWDQRVVHGSSPNHSNKIRAAQFIRAFQRSGVSSGRFKARSDYLNKELLSRVQNTFQS